MDIIRAIDNAKENAYLEVRLWVLTAESASLGECDSDAITIIVNAIVVCFGEQFCCGFTIIIDLDPEEGGSDRV